MNKKPVAVILAAGQSSRFYPLASGIHKSMVKLLGRPILEEVIIGLEKAGVNNLVLIVDSSSSIKTYFGDGKRLNVKITYVLQEKPTGAGNALLLARKYIKGDFFLLNGYHVEAQEFIKDLENQKKENTGAVLLIKEKTDIWDSGVVKILGNKLEELVEKPEKGKEPSNLCVVGIYLFSNKFLDQLVMTPDDHYRLEAAISVFSKNNDVRVFKTNKQTVVLKYPWDLFSVKDYLLKSEESKVSKKTTISKNSLISGKVIIQDGVTIMDGAKIKGPCYIGKNSYIGTNAIIREKTIIEENVVIGAFSEIKNSIIMSGSKTHSGFIGDSIIGENCRIGAQFCTSNVRLDRETIKANVKGKKVDTGLKSFGTVVGKNVHIGIKSSTMPGVIIGNNAIIGPSTTVLGDVEADTKYYSKFQEIVVKK